MLIECHSLTNNEKIWVDPDAIMMATFQEGATTLMLTGGIAIQIVESQSDLRGMLDQFSDVDPIIVAQAYTD